jgi:hypothetical protein
MEVPLSPPGKGRILILGALHWRKQHEDAVDEKEIILSGPVDADGRACDLRPGAETYAFRVRATVEGRSYVAGFGGRGGFGGRAGQRAS